MNDFYVYVIFRPNGTPCYVGKGRGRRWLKSKAHTNNKHLQRIMEKAGQDLPRVKVREHLTEKDAFATETSLILALGRIKDGGCLANVVLGGGGVSGLNHTADAKKRISDGLRGIVRSDQTRQKMSAAQKGRTVSDKTRRLLSIAGTGSARHVVPHTEETKTKLRASTLAHFDDPLAREAARRRHAAQFSDPERKENHRQAMRLWWANPDNRKRMSVIKKGKPMPIANLIAIRESRARKRA